MKKIFILLATVFICALSCETEPLEGEFVVDDGTEVTDDTTDDTTGDGTDDDADPEPGIFSFNLDIDAVALNPSTLFLSEATFLGVERINISGLNETTNQLFAIGFEKNLAAGSYEFGDSPSDQVIAQYTPDSVDPITVLISVSGTFELVEVTPEGRYIGTFELTVTNAPIGTDTSEITNGVFDFQL